MKLNLAVDIISDLNLIDTDSFDWEGKPTSLFCIVAGNVSTNLDIVKMVLEKLSKLYRGVFYIDGYLENIVVSEYYSTVEKIKNICNVHNNVVYLHNHVVVLNGVALTAINGWDKTRYVSIELDEDLTIVKNRITDISYVKYTLKKLQAQKEARKVVLISSSVPDKNISFDKLTEIFDSELELSSVLQYDTDVKITTWIFGGTNLLIDSEINFRRFVNNPCVSGQPYWPKRIEL